MAFTNETVPLGLWLDRLGERTPTPSGGSAAAVTLAVAAALASMVAAYSDFSGPAVSSSPSARESPGSEHARDSEGIRRLATSVRSRALALASSDEAAVLALLSAPSLRTRSDAAGVPLEVARLAGELAPAFHRLIQDGNARLRGDAIVGAHLVRGAAAAAGELVRIDAASLGEVERNDLLAALADAEAQVSVNLAR